MARLSLRSEHIRTLGVRLGVTFDAEATVIIVQFQPKVWWRSPDVSFISFKAVIVIFDWSHWFPLLKVLGAHHCPHHHRQWWLGYQLQSHGDDGLHVEGFNGNRVFEYLGLLLLGPWPTPGQISRHSMLGFCPGIMIGFQTDPQYANWDSWVYFEHAFAGWFGWGWMVWLPREDEEGLEGPISFESWQSGNQIMVAVRDQSDEKYWGLVDVQQGNIIHKSVLMLKVWEW